MNHWVAQLNDWLVGNSQLSQSDTKTADQVRQSQAELAALCGQIKAELHELVYGSKRRQHIVRQLQQWQHELTLLLNQLANTKGHGVLERALTAALLAQYQHLAQYYPSYFNEDGPMPSPLASEVKAQLAEQLPLLAAALKQRKVTEELSVPIVKAFDQLAVAEGYSYRQWRYWQTLLSNLIRFCRDIANVDLQPLLQEHLIYLRFDSMACYHFMERQLMEQLALCYDPNEQYDLLCALKKRLVLQQECQNFVRQQVGLALRELLLDLVWAELAYMQRRQKTEDYPPPAQANQYRVGLGISVDALAYLLKLSISVGLINASPRSTFLAFVAQHFQTLGIGEAKISVNSLNAKYKQVVQHTALKVRVLLRRMIKQIDSEFDLN